MFGTVLAAATMFFAAPSAAPAKPPLKMLWGGTELPTGGSAFPTYQRLGVDVLQAQLQWRNVATQRPQDPRNPDDPAYDWPDDVTGLVRGAARSDIDVMLMVKTTPGWANGGRDAARVPNRDRDYADFLIAAAERYPSVRNWMVWGEPQRPQNFDPMPPNSPRGPRRYAKLLDTAYGALKSVRRSNKVIGGNTWTFGLVNPSDFVRWMRLPNGKPPRLDYFGHNPFSTRFPKLSGSPYYKGLRDISDSDTLSREVRRAYRSRKVKPKLWLSEFTVPSQPSNIINISVSEQEQAQWIRAAFRLAGQRRANVVGLGWFRLADTPELASGLLAADGRRKPAYEAYRRAR